ncbi:phage tail protein I [Halopseudomonas bauzanensis]|uniref:phage tail protein I n=1 Tax=Halopseudomonas bauzanensis TaxID=653930 RepID=UPI003523F77D
MSSLLPPSSSALESALEKIATRFDSIPVPLRQIWNADTCPEDLLPWLARAVSVDVWDTNWSSEQKRAAIKTSIEVHRRKGTIGAVLEALRALGFEARVQEWFNQVPPAPEYTYRLILEADQTGFSRSDIDLLLMMVDNTKNLRSHLTYLTPIIQTQAGPRTAAAAGLGSEVTLMPGIEQEISILPGFFPAEALINTITNYSLAQTLGN